MRKQATSVRAPLRDIFVLLITCSCFGLVARPAHASGYLGYVGAIVQVGSTIYIQFSNGNFSPNSCGAATLWVTMDPTTPTGQASLAMALSAKATGGQVWAQGNAVCAPGGPNGTVTEGLSVIYLD